MIGSAILENPEFESHGIMIRRAIDYVFQFVGIALALVRMTEPYFWRHMVSDFKNLFRRIFCFLCSKPDNESKKQRYSNEPLCAFANSAMNIEFVYLILLGVNNFMSN